MLSATTKYRPPEWDTERLVLRVERDRLTREHAFLQAESVRLKGSADRRTLRELARRLHSHGGDVQAYSAALHHFHERVGPLSRESTVNGAKRKTE